MESMDSVDRNFFSFDSRKLLLEKYIYFKNISMILNESLNIKMKYLEQVFEELIPSALRKS